MTVTAEELTQYEGKKVIVVRKAENGDALEVEGTAEAANALGLLLKPKGRTQLELIEPGDIEEIRFAPIKNKELKRAELGLVGFGSARKHLLDRHAYTLTDMNALDEEGALKLHGETDHEKSDLGHVHVEKKAEEKAEAVPEESA